MLRRWITLGLSLILAASPLRAQVAQNATASTLITRSFTPTVRGDKEIVVDEKNHSLIIRTTPSNHRKIMALLARITVNPNQGRNLKTQSFSLMNLSQQEFFDLVKYQTNLDPLDKEKFLVMQDGRNRPVFANTIPANKLLPLIPAAGGNAITGGSTGGSGVQTLGGSNGTAGGVTQ